MENKVSPGKSGILLGVLFGVIMILEFVIIYIIGIQNLTDKIFSIAINFLNYLILPIIFIYLGCNQFKKINNGFISFSQALRVGVSITVIAGLVYAIFSIIFNLIFPEFTTEMLAVTRSEMIKSSPQLTQKQIDMAIIMTKKFMNPYIMMPFTIVMYALIGLIYSLIIGAIIKKDAPKSFN